MNATLIIEKLNQKVGRETKKKIDKIIRTLMQRNSSLPHDIQM